MMPKPLSTVDWKAHTQRLLEILSDCDWSVEIDGQYARWFYEAKSALREDSDA